MRHAARKRAGRLFAQLIQVHLLQQRLDDLVAVAAVGNAFEHGKVAQQIIGGCFVHIINAQPTEAGTGVKTAELIFVKSEGKRVRMDLLEVLFIEGLKDYIAIQMPSGKLIIHSTMKSLEEKLAGLSSFLRIHKSYLVHRTGAVSAIGAREQLASIIDVNGLQKCYSHLYPCPR